MTVESGVLPLLRKFLMGVLPAHKHARTHTSNLDFQLTQSPEERNGSTVRWKVSAIVDVSTKRFSYVTAESAQRQSGCRSAVGKPVWGWKHERPWKQNDRIRQLSQRFIGQVHRADQALLPAQVDSFVGCSLHCALHPPAYEEKCWKTLFPGLDTHKSPRSALFFKPSVQGWTHTDTHRQVAGFGAFSARM